MIEGIPFGLSPTAWTVVERGTKAVITLVVALLLLRLVRPLERMVIRGAKRHGDERKGPTSTMLEQERRAETLTRVTGSVARAIIWGLTLVIVLASVGVDIQPLVAGAGVAGVAVGFGAQSIVKDFFAGFFILLEAQFDVGDTVTVSGVTGTVERMTMRITVLRDPQGTAHFIPNSAITTVANRTDGWGKASVEIVFGSGVSETDARTALDAAAARASRTLELDRLGMEPVAVEGPTEFGPGGITWRLSSKVRPERAPESRQAMISSLAAELQGRGFVSEGTAMARPTVSRPAAKA